MVKLLTLILSAYFFALSALPCVDGNDVNDLHGEISHSTDDNKDHADSCSPFCVCACCGMTLSNYAPVYTFGVKVQTVPIIKAESQYRSDFISSYQQSIWQPPQLS